MKMRRIKYLFLSLMNIQQPFQKPLPQGKSIDLEISTTHFQGFTIEFTKVENPSGLCYTLHFHKPIASIDAFYVTL
jgi:hypothetical protein